MSPEQQKILDYVRAHGTISTADATALVGRNLDANATKHTCQVLSRMVKTGLLLQVTPGTFMTPQGLELVAVGRETRPGKVWLQHRDGEGGEFDAAQVAQQRGLTELKEFFERNF